MSVHNSTVHGSFFLPCNISDTAVYLYLILSCVLSCMSYRVCVDNLLNRDVDDRFAECHHVRVLVHVKLLLRSRNVTSCLEEAPENQKRKD